MFGDHLIDNPEQIDCLDLKLPIGTQLLIPDTICDNHLRYHAPYNHHPVIEIWHFYLAQWNKPTKINTLHATHIKTFWHNNEIYSLFLLPKK